MGTVHSKIPRLYDVEQGDLVKIGVIGHKEHNTLYVRGQEIEI
jgi:hypothetical protein